MLDKIINLRENKRLTIAGIMSGTSVDGIDVAICEFETIDGNFNYTLLAASTIPFTGILRTKILNLFYSEITIEKVAEINVMLSQEYSNAVDTLCDKFFIDKSAIDLISIHGQTVWHRGNKDISKDYNNPITLQLGSLPYLAILANKPVVGNFREADCALQGQGAPLIPIFDYHFLKNKLKHTTALNIGGMSNLTFLPTNSLKNDVIAFDTGPGNVWIDYAMNVLYGRDYDANGEVAESGSLIPELFQELKSIKYIYQKPPKSTGRELFTSAFAEELIHKYLDVGCLKNDIISTFSTFTAFSIAENIRLFGSIITRIIVSGGGAKNSFIIKKLKEFIPTSEVIISDDINISSDYKEAICFAFLGYLNILNLPGNMPSVTGASREAVLGLVAYP